VFVSAAERIRGITGIEKTALSGGCFQNMFLLRHIKDGLRKRGFEVYNHTRVPTNDGGISLGQAVIAAELACTNKAID